MTISALIAVSYSAGRMPGMRLMASATAGLALLALGACGSDSGSKQSSGELPKGGEAVKLDPADFSTRIDNPYLPFAVGSKWTYREVEDGVVQKVVVTVTPKTKLIANGVRARVVHDQVTANGRVKEDTFDWYAQDKDGNVWYLGEDTTEYPKGKPPSKAGSFEAGVNGAQAGVAMPAHPEPGLSYRQEYLKGEAEDRGKVLRLDARAKVPFGSFDHLLLTEDSTPLEPDATEHKYYAKGVGSVLEKAVAGNARAELVNFAAGTAAP
jgi:hypothetical protein